jgi:predicted RecB family nuclease
MRLHEARLILSPSDLNDFLECEHLTQLEIAVARDEIERPVTDNPQAELIRHKGEEHERAYLQILRDEAKEVVEIEDADADATKEALRAGAEVIYQAGFEHEGWRGIADFLERVGTPSDLGPWSYEVADTKLARHSKPTYILQLCFYTEQVARIQGREPDYFHVILGSGERDSYRPSEFSAYYRRVRARFLAALEAGIDVYPLPVPHCPFCDFKERCEQRWEEDDHPVLVASIRRDQIPKLAAMGITTLEELANAQDDERPPQMQPATFDSLRVQAELQLHHRTTGEHTKRLLQPEAARGFALLPPPSPGDLFFDIEGDPFWEPRAGLEYLWGVSNADGYRAFWAHDREQEKQALEDFVDLVRERLERDPTLHVYHYASYETSALKRLMGEYGTREDEIDDLLRRGVFVDLFRVVRQALRHSHPRYSLKNVETFFMEREAELRAGDDSILMYEQWLDTRDGALLQELEAYNAEDCESTRQLRDWLLELRAEAESQYGRQIAWPGLPELREPPEGTEETAELQAALLADEEDELHRLAGQLLDYHRREAKPVWWAFFNRYGSSPEELSEIDVEAIGGIEPDGPPVGSGKSLVHPFTFPPQQHKLSPGQSVSDPLTLDSAGTIDWLDDEHGRLGLRRGPRHEDLPLPRSLIPGGAIPTKAQQEALRRLGRSILDGSPRYPALEAILRRDLPRIRGHEAGAPLPQDDLEAARDLVEGLDSSFLVVQGPPGSGKTYTAARLIVRLISRGRRVGVTALSHKAINNLLAEVEKVAREEGVEFSGLKKGGDYEGPFIESSGNQADFDDPGEHLLLAGTSWLFSRASMEGLVDTLFVDEAGQFALADALASGTSARNVVLLGDQQQLAQVSQGIHPEGAGASVLEHLLAGEETVPPERGLFLGKTWRMHPKICQFVSEMSYEGRLHPVAQCARRAVNGEAGLRFIAVEHEGNRQASREEADVIAREIQSLVGGTYTNCDGVERRLGYDDILVVAPYNAQVRCLRAALPERVRVGTVDKFQGQEAPVVFFSMATSSGDDLVRAIGFLFSRNRLNVAVSRAKALAVLVCSPKLLEIRCRTIEDMRLVNALCRFVELASEDVGRAGYKSPT